MPDSANNPQSAATATHEPLPRWPGRTVGVLATCERDQPHAIPVSAPVRTDDRTIWLNLHQSRESLHRLRANPEVALLILASGNTAFTARGRARVVEEAMAAGPDYAAIAIDVDCVDDHRQPPFEVSGGVDRTWLDQSERTALGERVRALSELAASRAPATSG